MLGSQWLWWTNISPVRFVIDCVVCEFMTVFTVYDTTLLRCGAFQTDRKMSNVKYAGDKLFWHFYCHASCNVLLYCQYIYYPPPPPPTHTTTIISQQSASQLTTLLHTQVCSCARIRTVAGVTWGHVANKYIYCQHSNWGMFGMWSHFTVSLTVILTPDSSLATASWLQ